MAVSAGNNAFAGQPHYDNRRLGSLLEEITQHAAYKPPAMWDFLQNNTNVILDPTGLDEDRCTICWEVFATRSVSDESEEPWCMESGEVAVRVQPCGHVFGSVCLYKWCSTSAAAAGRCPHCRARLWNSALSAFLPRRRRSIFPPFRSHTNWIFAACYQQFHRSWDSLVDKLGSLDRALQSGASAPVDARLVHAIEKETKRLAGWVKENRFRIPSGIVQTMPAFCDEVAILCNLHSTRNHGKRLDRMRRNVSHSVDEMTKCLVNCWKAVPQLSKRLVHPFGERGAWRRHARRLRVNLSRVADDHQVIMGQSPPANSANRTAGLERARTV